MSFASELLLQVVARSSIAAALAKPAKSKVATALETLEYIFERTIRYVPCQKDE